MPTKIRVLSWNVESLGDTKAVQPGTQPATASELINFINLVVRHQSAHVVGIMELKGGVGGQVRDRILAKDNNARPGPPFAYTWRARLSSRQDGGTRGR